MQPAFRTDPFVVCVPSLKKPAKLIGFTQSSYPALMPSDEDYKTLCPVIAVQRYGYYSDIPKLFNQNCRPVSKRPPAVAVPPGLSPCLGRGLLRPRKATGWVASGA